MHTLSIPMLVKDRDVEAEAERRTGKDWAPFELTPVTVSSLLPGPVSDRVAVIDLRDRVLHAPAPVPTTEQGLLPQTSTPFSEPSVVRWSVFATVLHTLALFERPDCLGRSIPWAFGRPQLLVVPEAREDANAFYERGSRSLQFGWFTTPAGDRVHAAACHDIVAHEAAHAVLDGVAPWLFDAAGPEAVALHEAVADLTALFASASSPKLVEQALGRTNGALRETPLLSALAPEFGRGIGEAGPLRSLVDPDPERPLSLAEFGANGREPEPHDLSLVLSRAFYAVLVDAYDARLLNPPRARPPRVTLRLGAAPPTPGHAHATALRFAADLVQRLLYRGLDYLPPGDVTFVDLARAVLACDRAAHPDDPGNVRALVVQRLLERGIGRDAADLDTPFEALRDAVGEVTLDALATSDWFAMRWVEGHRAPLGIPDRVPFDLLPRAEVKKVLIRPTERPVREELLLKVSWREKEPFARPPAGMPPAVWVRRGVTLAFDAAGPRGGVCAVVRTSPAAALQAAWLAMPNQPLTYVVRDGAFEVQGAFKTLHARAGGTAKGQPASLPAAPAGVDASAFYELWRAEG